MKKKFIVSILIGVLLVLTALQVSAFPGTPFSGNATGQAVDVELAVDADLGLVSLLDIIASIDVVNHTSHVEGTGTDGVPNPVQTDANGNGIDVTGTASVGGAVGVSIGTDILNAVTDVTFPDPAETDSASLASASVGVGTGDLISAGGGTDALTTNAASSIAGTDATDMVADSNGDTEVNDLAISTAALVAGLAGDAIVQADTVTASSSTVTTDTGPGGNDQVISTAASGIEQTDDPVGLNILDGLVTADTVLSNVSTTCDGTDAGTSGTASITFVDLLVNGDAVTGIGGGTAVVDVSAGAPSIVVNVAGVGTVTIGPVGGTTSSAAGATAEAVAIRVELTAGDLAGTTIDIAASSADCAANAGTTGPTAIGMLNGQAAASQDRVILAVMTAGLLMLGAASVVVLQKRSHERMNQ